MKKEDTVRYDITEHNVELHTWSNEFNKPIPQHTLKWYKFLTTKGEPRCPTCGATAVVKSDQK